jgi:hypothetical protein
LCMKVSEEGAGDVKDESGWKAAPAVTVRTVNVSSSCITLCRLF